jgi:FAD/FMN-containing dehydrogenase
MPTLSKACARRDGRADASVYCSWCWLDPAVDDVNVRWTRELAEVMRPFTTGSDYVNQIGLETDEGSERIKAAYGANYERLVAVKNKYDPTNLFRHNQNIKPTV